jgi:hypothetical protein
MSTRDTTLPCESVTPSGVDPRTASRADLLAKRCGEMLAEERVIVEMVETDQGRHVIYVRCGNAVEIIPSGGDIVTAMLVVLAKRGAR